jgi:hypothetical protein
VIAGASGFCCFAPIAVTNGEMVDDATGVDLQGTIAVGCPRALFAGAVTVTHVTSVAVSKFDIVMTLMVVEMTVDHAVLPGILETSVLYCV